MDNKKILLYSASVLMAMLGSAAMDSKTAHAETNELRNGSFFSVGSEKDEGKFWWIQEVTYKNGQLVKSPKKGIMLPDGKTWATGIDRLNQMGYNDKDGYLYFKSSGKNNFYKVSTDGILVDSWQLPPISEESWRSGAFDEDGFWVGTSDPQGTGVNEVAIYRYDVSNKTAGLEKTILDDPYDYVGKRFNSIGDIALAKDGYAYGVVSDQTKVNDPGGAPAGIIKINLNTATIEEFIEVPGVEHTPSVSFLPDGSLIFAHRDGITASIVDLSTGKIVMSQTNFVDDKSVDFANPGFPDINPAELEIGKEAPTVVDEGEVFKFTMHVRNVGGLVSTDSIVKDALPEGVEYVPGSTTLNGNKVADIDGQSPLFTDEGLSVSSPGAPKGQIGQERMVDGVNIHEATITFEVRAKDGTGGSTITNEAKAFHHNETNGHASNTTETYVREKGQVPTRPVDKDGNEIKTPDGKMIPKMPDYKGNPGDKIVIKPEDLPDIPGYNKPKEPFEVIFPGKDQEQIIDVPYEKQKEVPTIPVDKDGNEIKTPEGEKMPEVPGKPGDVVEIDINDLPDIPGYDKPTPDANGKIKITVPEEGKSVEIPYTEKKTPSVPVDKETGKEIKTDKSFPSIKGKPGDMVEIDINDLPDIPGFSKPKADKNGKIKVQIPEDGKPVEIPYQPDTQSRPVDKNTGKEIKTDKNFPTIKGHPGDVVEVDVNDLPEIPGYNKQKGDKNGKIKVTIPENGMIDFGYTPIEAGKPGQPEQNNNGSKNTPENKTPEKGKSKGEASYPNTGSETNVLVSALGAAMLALTGLFAGLTKLRKK